MNYHQRELKKLDRLSKHRRVPYRYRDLEERALLVAALTIVACIVMLAVLTST